MSRGAEFIRQVRPLRGLAFALVSLSLPLGVIAAQCPLQGPTRQADSAGRAFSISSDTSCRRGGAVQSSIEQHRFSVGTANGGSAPAAAAVLPDLQSANASRFDVRWRPVIGPVWVQSVPAWMIDNARSYRHRGLPIVHLWESSHYQIALGLSNRGVPGVYFSQKLP